MFDRTFFADVLPDRVRQFGLNHGVKSVKLVIVTRDGTRLDVRELNTNDQGMHVVTVDEAMVFVPYHEIQRIEVSVRAKEKGKKSPVGFQPPE